MKWSDGEVTVRTAGPDVVIEIFESPHIVEGIADALRAACPKDQGYLGVRNALSDAACEVERELGVDA